MLIVLRRIVAIPLALLLVPVVGVALASWYLGDVTDDASFAKDELIRLDVYDYVHDSLLPTALDRYLDDEEALPTALAETLPRDPQSRTVMLDFARDMIPPEFLQRQAEHVVDEFWPYLFGSTDQFEIRFALGERLEAATGHAPGEQSALERTFRDRTWARG